MNTLPSIFNILNDQKVDFKTSEENLILSLGGFIADNYVQSLFTSTATTDLLKEYFNVYADTYTLPEVSPVVRQIKAVNNNTYGKEKQELLKKINGKYIPFPFYSKTEFTNLSSDSNSLAHVMGGLGDLEKELLQPEEEESTELGEVPQEKFKGSIPRYGFPTRGIYRYNY